MTQNKERKESIQFRIEVRNLAIKMGIQTQEFIDSITYLVACSIASLPEEYRILGYADVNRILSNSLTDLTLNFYDKIRESNDTNQ